MPVAKIILIIYGVLMIGGSFMGLKAGSKISLIAGLVSGALVFMGLFLTKSNPQMGYGIVAATSGLLCVVFFMRLMKTQAFMPSGMLIIISIIALVASVSQLLNK